jgi:hypothetical protein
MRRVHQLAVFYCVLAGACSSQNTPATLDLCSVISNIGAYNRQRVRLSAFLGAGSEQDVLYDPKCQGGKPLVYVSMNPKISGDIKALRHVVGKKRYAWVVLEGVMRGPEPVKIDPKLPDWLKDRFKNSSQRYGHLDSFEMMIEVDRVVQVRDVDDGMSSTTKPKK